MTFLTMRSALLSCAAVGATLTLAGAIRPAWADKAHPVIGFASYGTPTFMITGKEGAQIVADANGATLLWVTAKMDVQTQISRCSSSLTRRSMPSCFARLIL